MSNLQTSPEKFIGHFSFPIMRLSSYRELNGGSESGFWIKELSDAARSTKAIGVPVSVPSIADRGTTDEQSRELLEDLVRKVWLYAADRTPEYLEAKRRAEANLTGMAFQLTSDAKNLRQPPDNAIHHAENVVKYWATSLEWKPLFLQMASRLDESLDSKLEKAIVHVFDKLIVFGKSLDKKTDAQLVGNPPADIAYEMEHLASLLENEDLSRQQEFERVTNQLRRRKQRLLTPEGRLASALDLLNDLLGEISMHRSTLNQAKQKPLGWLPISANKIAAFRRVGVSKSRYLLERASHELAEGTHNYDRFAFKARESVGFQFGMQSFTAYSATACVIGIYEKLVYAREEIAARMGLAFERFGDEAEKFTREKPNEINPFEWEQEFIKTEVWQANPHRFGSLADDISLEQLGKAAEEEIRQVLVDVDSKFPGTTADRKTDEEVRQWAADIAKDADLKLAGKSTRDPERKPIYSKVSQRKRDNPEKHRMAEEYLQSQKPNV